MACISWKQISDQRRRDFAQRPLLPWTGFAFLVHFCEFVCHLLATTVQTLCMFVASVQILAYCKPSCSQILALPFGWCVSQFIHCLSLLWTLYFISQNKHSPSSLFWRALTLFSFRNLTCKKKYTDCFNNIDETKKSFLWNTVWTLVFKIAYCYLVRWWTPSTLSKTLSSLLGFWRLLLAALCKTSKTNVVTDACCGMF